MFRVYSKLESQPLIRMEMIPTIDNKLTAQYCQTRMSNVSRGNGFRQALQRLQGQPLTKNHAKVQYDVRAIRGACLLSHLRCEKALNGSLKRDSSQLSYGRNEEDNEQYQTTHHLAFLLLLFSVDQNTLFYLKHSQNTPFHLNEMMLF